MRLIAISFSYICTRLVIYDNTDNSLDVFDDSIIRMICIYDDMYLFIKQWWRWWWYDLFLSSWEKFGKVFNMPNISCYVILLIMEGQVFFCKTSRFKDLCTRFLSEQEAWGYVCIMCNRVQLKVQPYEWYVCIWIIACWRTQCRTSFYEQLASTQHVKVKTPLGSRIRDEGKVCKIGNMYVHKYVFAEIRRV